MGWRLGRKSKATAAALGLLLMTAVVPSSAAEAAPVAVYDSVPDPLTPNLFSVGFAATSTAEYGDLVELSPAGGVVTSASAVMMVWACETGTYNGGDCDTTPGATFSQPLTMTLYEVGGTAGAPTVGPALTSVTQTFDLPFRPSFDDQNCVGGRWFDGTSCWNSFPAEVTFDFPADTTLPDSVIWGLSFNTENSGYNPTGVPDTNAGNLNLAVTPTAPSVGADVDPTVNFSAVGVPAPAGMTSAASSPINPSSPILRLEVASVPAAPTGVTAVAGDGQVTLSWSAPADDGGSPITGYVVGGDGTCTPDPATATSCVITGLTNGQPVSFTVAATNAVGTGPEAASEPVTPVAPPTPTTTPPDPTTVPTTAAPAPTTPPPDILPETGPSETTTIALIGGLLIVLGIGLTRFRGRSLGTD